MRKESQCDPVKFVRQEILERVDSLCQHCCGHFNGGFDTCDEVENECFPLVGDKQLAIF